MYGQANTKCRSRFPTTGCTGHGVYPNKGYVLWDKQVVDHLGLWKLEMAFFLSLSEKFYSTFIKDKVHQKWHAAAT